MKILKPSPLPLQHSLTSSHSPPRPGPHPCPAQDPNGSPLRLIKGYYVNLGRCKSLIPLQKKHAVFAAAKPA